LTTKFNIKCEKIMKRHTKFLKLFLVLTVIIAGCKGSSSPFTSGGSMDWTLFRADATLSGYTETRLPDNPELLWT